MAKVLLVEDNKDLANLVRSYLEFEKHTVHTAFDGQDGRDSILNQPFDLIILDWDLPELSGIEILRDFRAQGGNTPVIMLTGRQSADEKETGLDEGADDYLTKPFDMKELGARVRAQLRRSVKAHSSTALQLSDIIIDTQKQRATRAGRTVALTTKEFQLLEFCARYPHLELNLSELQKQIWTADTELTDDAVLNTIRRLRKKLDPDGRIICPHISSAKASVPPNESTNSRSEQTHSATQLGQAELSISQDIDGSDEEDPYIGTIFDEKYELLELIGGGGTGLVYRAKHCVIGNVVALKLLYPHLIARNDIIKRFTQEARSAGILSHENIIVIHDFGQNDLGQPYLVMELIEGESLSDIIKARGKLPASHAIDLFLQTCEGIAHAHDKGVVHRDIKPSNILTAKQADGSVQVKVVDFGLAKPTHAEGGLESITQTGEVFGSPPYMSPEQCRGSKADERSDVYALGCVFFEMLMGNPPFSGSTAIQTIMQQVSAEPPHLERTDIAQSAIKKLDDIIQRCLAKSPKDRYQTVKDLAQAVSYFSTRN